MGIFEATILGIIQGLAEFLPISSSGHLVLAQHFFGWTADSNTSFEIFVHLGSLMAVLIYFRVQILSLLKSLVYFKDKALLDERKMCLWICIASFVTGVIGLTCKDIFEKMFANPLLVACMLAVTGGVIFFSDRIKTLDSRPQKTDTPPLTEGSRQQTSENSSLLTSNSTLNPIKSAFIGFGQAIAIIPGLSRSGTTITCALLAKLDRKTAASFSFILSIPAILGANLSELKNIASLDTSQLWVYITGFIAAFGSGYLVIGLLLKLIQRAKLSYFSYYCWTVSIICIVLLIMNYKL